MPDPDATTRLDDHAGRHPVVLLFAPSIKSPSYEKQIEQLIGGEEELAARGALLAAVLEQGESHLGGFPLAEGEEGHLRGRFGVAAGAFCIVLLPAGGEPTMRDAPLKLETILAGLQAA